MKLIKPYYEIRTPINGEEILIAIEQAARTCYKSEERIEVISGHATSARTFVSKLISRGHEAMLEFGGMINVLFVCDRGVSHELVRHRVASFAQESTRYCNYNKDDITFIIPNWITELPDIKTLNTKVFDNTISNEEGCILTWYDSCEFAEESYKELINHGWTPQQARSVLPNSLKTEINVSANIREWRHIFRLRASKAAHPSMRELMIPLLEEFKSKIPILFDDINY